MLAAGDPHLVALEAIACAQRIGLKPRTIWHGAGGHVAEAGAGLRLRQAHGARPATGEFVLGKHLFLRLRAMHHQQVGIAGGEHARTNADRGAGKKCVGCGLHAVGQLHAANVVVLRGAEHAGLGVGTVGVMGSLR